MFQFRPKGNSLFSYDICDFKGMNLQKAKKEYISKRNEIGKMYVDMFVESSKYFSEFKDVFTEEDKEIVHELLWRFGDGLNKKQEKYLIENSNARIIIKTKNNLKKRQTSLRLEEAFLFTLLITENTDDITHALREAIAKYIIDNNYMKVLEKVSRITESGNIKTVDDFLRSYT